MTNSEELYTGEDFEITEVPTEAECRATRIALMATWIKQVNESVKETGVPKDINIDHEGEYILYTVDCMDPFEDAKELYENGWRLVSTKTEKIPDFWGTGLALKFVA